MVCSWCHAIVSYRIVSRQGIDGQGAYDRESSNVEAG